MNDAMPAFSPDGRSIAFVRQLQDAGDLYLLVAEIDLPAGTDAAALDAAIGAVASSLGVGASLREAEADQL